MKLAKFVKKHTDDKSEVIYSIRIDKETDTKVTALMERLKITKTEFVKSAIRMALEEK
jgi:predicted DNA-binding protein